MTTDPKALVARLRKGYDLDVMAIGAVMCEGADAIEQLQRERDANAAKAQVMHDLHNALGVPWGDDPYARIHALKKAESALAAATADREGLEGILRTMIEDRKHGKSSSVAVWQSARAALAKAKGTT